MNSDRLSLEQLITSSITNHSDLLLGLSSYPKSIPTRYFYDDRGSELFEQICELPEYYPTRTEALILYDHALEIAKFTGSCELVELGSGSATKTRILLDAYQQLNFPLRYVPIDVSAGILESSAFALLNDYPTLEVHGLVATYETALQRLRGLKNYPRRLVVFLGSTLGNLNPQECDYFFEQITGALQTGDYFLLGVDLHKDKQILEPAYNDAQGITAEFNLNMLHHLNQRFGSNFDLSQFRHRAVYNEYPRQIEMYLHSQVAQTVELLERKIHFEAGEPILTEISRKFTLSILKQDLQNKGLEPVKTWTDPQGWFAMVLCRL